MYKQPDNIIAADIAAQFCGERPQSVQRFSMGIGHWVYDVLDAKGRKFVVRVGASDQGADFVGALHWSSVLRPVGIPLPAVLASGHWCDLPYVILERLAGNDLGIIYESLEYHQKQAIAAQVCRIQCLVATLGEGSGYGYVRLPSGPYKNSWKEVLEESIARSRSRIESAKLVSLRSVERVAEAMHGFEAYFSRIRPVPFLDDTTTKNVLVHDGTLAGIVDVDWICFGDPLLTLALTRTSLLSSKRDTHYTDHWAELLGVTTEQQGVIRFYTALYCLDFMSELGHRFNRDAPTIDQEDVLHLERLLDNQLHDL